jgi:hypothetical protein
MRIKNRNGSSGDFNGVGWYILLAAFFILIVTFRGDTRDTSVYVSIYNDVKDFPFNPIIYYTDYGVEWGYGIISYLFNAMNLSVRVLFFFTSFLIFILIAKTSMNFGISPIYVLPFYVGSFFLTQQFTQIRQALATAMAFYAISLLIIAGKKIRIKYISIVGLAAISIHMTAFVVLIVGFSFKYFYLNKVRGELVRVNILVFFTLISSLLIVACRIVMSTDSVALFSRVSSYLDDDEFGLGRGLFEPANIRALAFLIVILFLAKKELYKNTGFLIILFAFCCSIGIRFGFFDFAILSGRLGGALNLAEIYLFAFVFNGYFRCKFYTLWAGVIYMILHSYIVLEIQMPYLFGDYFTPLSLSN